MENLSKFFIQISISNTRVQTEIFFPYSQFLEYIIDLKLNNKSWKVFRRYNQFYELNYQLSKHISNLPQFPPKVLFITENKKKTRQVKLQNFLIELFQRKEVYQLDKLFEFVELEKEYYLMSTTCEPKYETIDNFAYSTCDTNPKFDRIKSSLQQGHPCSEVQLREDFFYSFSNYTAPDFLKEIEGTKSPIDILLEELSQKSCDKSSVIIGFENTFKEYFQNPSVQKCFSKGEIFKLFFGEPNSVNFSKGLLYHMGKIEENQVGAVACLKFVSRLIDCEYNIDNENYISIFKMGKLKTLEEMRLYEHLQSNNEQITFKCFTLLKCLAWEDKESIVEILLKRDKKLIKKYKLWLVD